MRGHLKQLGEAVVQCKRYAVIAGTVVRAEHGDVRCRGGQGGIGLLNEVLLGNVFITPVLVDALLVLVIDVQLPGLREGVLEAGAGLDAYGLW